MIDENSTLKELVDESTVIKDKNTLIKNDLVGCRDNLKANLSNKGVDVTGLNKMGELVNEVHDLNTLPQSLFWDRTKDLVSITTHRPKEHSFYYMKELCGKIYCMKTPLNGRSLAIYNGTTNTYEMKNNALGNMYPWTVCFENDIIYYSYSDAAIIKYNTITDTHEIIESDFYTTTFNNGSIGILNDIVYLFDPGQRMVIFNLTTRTHETKNNIFGSTGYSWYQQLCFMFNGELYVHTTFSNNNNVFIYKLNPDSKSISQVIYFDGKTGQTNRLFFTITEYRDVYGWRISSSGINYRWKIDLVQNTVTDVSNDLKTQVYACSLVKDNTAYDIDSDILKRTLIPKIQLQ